MLPTPSIDNEIRGVSINPSEDLLQGHNKWKQDDGRVGTAGDEHATKYAVSQPSFRNCFTKFRHRF